MINKLTGSQSRSPDGKKAKDRPSSWDAWLKRSLYVSSGPSIIPIHATGRCNLSCFMCWHNYIQDMNVTIDLEKLDPFFRDAEFVSLAGGESFWLTEAGNETGKKIVEMVLSRYPDISLYGYTNGTLLKGEMEQLALNSFEGVNFSIDTFDPALYEKIRGKPMLGSVLENMERLSRLKTELSLGANDRPFIIVNSIVMDDTLDGLPDIAEKLAALGGHKLMFTKLQDLFDPSFKHVGIKQRLDKTMPAGELKTLISGHSSVINRQRLTVGQIAEKRIATVSDRLMEISESTGLILQDKSHLLSLTPRKKLLSSEPESVCSRPWTTTYIHQDGNVFCCVDNSTLLGNISEQSFEEIWNGEAARDLRASFVKGGMKGCVRMACQAEFDHFTVMDSLKTPMVENLGAIIEAPKSVDSILLFRTAPLSQSLMTVQVIKEFFPTASLDIVTNSDGAEGYQWGKQTHLHVYKEEILEPDSFNSWWSGNGGGKDYSLVITLYGNHEREAYKNVEKISRTIQAGYRLGLKPDGSVILL